MTSTRKKITAIFFLASLFGLLLAQSESALAVTIPGTAQWAKSTEVIAPGITEFSASSTDSSGNTYAVGYITGTSEYDFGDVQVTGGFAGKNAVIVKHNAAGVALWAKSTAGNALVDSSFSGVSVDSDGNIYAVGYITGTSEYDFGGASVPVTGDYDGRNAVIVKYDSVGVAQWAKSTVTAPDVSEFKGVSVDSDGYIYAVGSIVTILDLVYPFAAIQYDFGDTAQVTGGFDEDYGGNPVIVKYDPDGVAQWAKSTVTAPDNSRFSGVSVDPDGYIYAVGRIKGISEYDFGGASVPVTGDYDLGFNAVIVKYDSSGLAQWAKSTVTAPESSYYSGVSVDSDGNIYAVGSIVTILDVVDPFAAVPYDFGDTAQVTGGFDEDYGGNPVIVKYDPDGVAQWAKSTVTAPDNSRFSGVSVDSDGYIYAVGYIGTSIDIVDPLITTPYNFGNSVEVTGGFDGNNTVIVKYDSSGLTQWAKSTAEGAPLTSQFSGVSIDSSGNIYAVGYIDGSDSPYGFGNDVTVTSGNSDGRNAVIVKYAPVIPVTPELPYTGGQTSSLASTGQPLWLLLIGLAGFASIVSGFVLTRKRAKA